MQFRPSQTGKLCSRNNNLYLADSLIYKKGVYSRRSIVKGETIEQCPLIIFPTEEVELVKNTVLYDYYFILQSEPRLVGLAMGYGSVYNHQCPSNAQFRYNRKKMLIEIIAKNDIEVGTEITINYNGRPNDPSPVFFKTS